MELSVTCVCGTRIPVTMTACGSTLECGCGSLVRVPNLSELRRSAGLTAFRQSTAEQLQSLYARGELPVEEKCIRCGGVTNSILRCTVYCEQPVAKEAQGSSGTAGVLLSALLAVTSVILLSLIAIVWPLRALRSMFGSPDGGVTIHGHEVYVRTPIRMCDLCLHSIRGRRDDVIQLMCRNELYQQLMNDYPDAHIHVEFPKT
jgi:hypothetical protein